jgi:UDP-N-acetylmuramate--alanine ligase
MARDSAQTIFFLGIAGSGMRGLAHLMHSRGEYIVGTDQNVSSFTALPHYELAPREEAGGLLEKSDSMIYSDAVSADHPLRQLARDKGIPQLSYPEALGMFSKTFTTLAVSGTHGKSSTTAFLAHILIEAGLDPTVLIGASLPAWGGENARVGKNKYFIVEADEYRDHFLTLSPAHAIITSIDWDHPDFFDSVSRVEKSYSLFLSRLSSNGFCFVPAAIRQAHRRVVWPSNTIEVLTASNLTLTLPGSHMKQNASLALALAKQLGVDREQGVASLKNFSGLGRRFERIGNFRGLELISDYGHHPEEIRATLQATKERHPDKRILVMFEAHTQERLQTFFDDYVKALALSSGVIICPVFVPKGREERQAKAQEFAKKLEGELAARQIPAWSLNNYDELPDVLRERQPQYDMAIAFTAGILDGRLRQLVIS